MATRNSRIVFFVAGEFLLLTILLALPLIKPPGFCGSRAYQDVLSQDAFGPRTPGSIAHAQEVAYIISNLIEAGWQVVVQNLSWEGFRIKNIIAYRDGQDSAPTILLGAHYDSRLIADQEQVPEQGKAVPGANDGASGVAVLLELARSLPEETVPVWLVFFDAEDNADLDGREGLMGSRAFVANLISPPQAVVIVDMVGDYDLHLYIESNSDIILVKEIWEHASELGYDQFIFETKYSIMDDHIPFLAAGIPAVDIIDFDYPSWHTLADTPDKVSPESLHAVGDTLWTWIVEK
jgi:Zn-dependent M28 family amino/carboxypeptidase